MRGTIYKRLTSSGRVSWRTQIDAGRDQDGRRIRITKTFKRKAAAETELARLLKEKSDGLLVKDSSATFGQFAKEWLEEHAARKCSPTTLQRYKQLMKRPVDELGQVRLGDLSPLILERFYGRLRDLRHEGGKPVLGPRTVRHVHDTIRCALNTAVRWKLLGINPAIACELPPIERREAQVVEDAQLRFLIDAANGHLWMHALLIVALGTGLRRGELLALRWADADLTVNSLAVSRSLEQTRAGLRIKTTKSGRARRLVLPQSVADALREHRQAQQANRDAFGRDYRLDLDLIFCTPEGAYLKPNTVSPAVCALAARVGLKGIGLHSLRHTHGSQLLSAGVPLPTVSKRLGHSSVNTTASIYAHSFAADEVAAAEAWEAKIGEALQRPHITQ